MFENGASDLKLKGNRLSWYGHVKRRDETHVTKRSMSRVYMWMDGEEQGDQRKDGWTL